GTLLVLGSIASAIFAVAMFRGRKFPFYRIVHSLLCLDCIYLLVQLSFIFPSMLSVSPNTIVDINATFAEADAWYNSKFILAARSIFDFLPPKGLLYLTLLMTLNRMAVFVVPSMQVIFSKKYVNGSIAVCWAFVCFFSVMCVLVRPTRQFNKKTMQFEDSGEAIVDAPLVRTIFDYSDIVIPFVMLFLYLIIYASLQKKRRVISATLSVEPRARDVDDKKMLRQAVLICVFLQLYNVVGIVAIVVDDRGIVDYALNMTSLILSVTNHSIHSTIFILSNKTIRGFIPSLSCCKYSHGNTNRAT
ncbi:hypothetical protein PMAYCL1PPCAC_17263, partial [Pristionchus mayeri]